VAHRSGLDGGSLWDDDVAAPAPRPLEAHVAVTSQCPVACSGCYQNAGPSGTHVDRSQLDRTIGDLAAAGVFTVAFGGGEPASRDDLADLADAVRANGMVPVVTTSGVGLTPARARAMRAFAQVNVSHDGVGASYRAVRGFDGAAIADRAIEMLVSAGVSVGVNFVVTRSSFDAIEATAMHVKSLGARELQLLRYKPAGRAASLDYLARRTTRAQNDALHAVLERLVRTHGDSLSVRIDCALVPMLSSHVSDVNALARWGVFGCEAGRHLVAVDRAGALAPCSFVHATGECRDTSFDSAWEARGDLAGFRAFVASPPEPCASCALRSVCRGGCKVVSAHFGSAMSPDPECPRVRAAEPRE
jgi:radical SAM protein with 4Fe4S-binding SPASM domain